MGLGKLTEDATVIPRATLGQMTVQFALESVSSLPWNHCPVCCGIAVQFAVEYARGTELRLHGYAGRRRFIPASAGNGSVATWPARRPSVHPRERGERGMKLVQDADIDGSSPRARGTAQPWRWRLALSRFIPASAGNGTTTAEITGPTGGSSPRARGTAQKQGDPG